MKTQVIINGKPVDAILNDEQIKTALENKKHTGLEYPGYDEIIYNIHGSQYTDNRRDTLRLEEFSDKQVCDDHRRAVDIYRRLLEAAAMVNSEPIDKQNNSVYKHFIYWDTDMKKLYTSWTAGMCYLTIYFESKEAANQAIDIVGKDDLIWLFRDFQPYIGAYKCIE